MRIWFAQLVSQETEETQGTALNLLRRFLSEVAHFIIKSGAKMRASTPFMEAAQ